MSFQRRASAFDLGRRMDARFMPEDSTAAGEEDDMAYAISSTYTPTLTPLDDGILEPDTYPWGWSRVGPGPGPQPGDTVTVYGAVFAGTNAEGPTNDGGIVSLPFVPKPLGPTSTHASSGYVDTAVDARALALVHPVAGFLLLLALDVTEAGGPVRIQITSTFQTANAVDP